MSKPKRREWIKQHLKDPYIKRAKQDGFRSRASYKLLEILGQDDLITPGMAVVDLGAAPGGWSQVVASIVGTKGFVLAIDIKPMEKIEGVKIVLGDFNEDVVLEKLLRETERRPIDLVISDMAPNVTGMKDIDQPRIRQLADIALDFAMKVLKPDGAFIVKLFQGSDINEFVQNVRTVFNTVKIKKPQASKSKSREVYLVARGFNNAGSVQYE